MQSSSEDTATKIIATDNYDDDEDIYDAYDDEFDSNIKKTEVTPVAEPTAATERIIIPAVSEELYCISYLGLNSG